MNDLLLTRTDTAAAGIRKRTLERSVKVGPISLRFATVLVLAVAALFYLAQSTQSATRGYQVQDLEREKEKLLEENEQLEVEKLRLQSLSQLKNSVGELGLEPE